MAACPCTITARCGTFPTCARYTRAGTVDQPGGRRSVLPQDGTWAWIESRRGKTRGKAKVTTCIPKGVLYQERFWNPEFLDAEDPTPAFTAMNYNVLTKTEAPYNPEFGTYTLRGIMVKVYPCPEGAPEGTWTEPADFEPWMPQPSDPTKKVF